MSIESRPHAAMPKPPLCPGEWFRKRAAGVVLHVTALPGVRGGRLGPVAHRFVDFLAEAGIGAWQTLPLGPVNESRSPYQPYSMLAGNPELIGFEPLVEDALLPEDYDQRLSTHALVRQAFDALSAAAPHPLAERFEAWCEREREWLHDHALFLALNDHLRTSWMGWPAPLRERDLGEIARVERELADEIRLVCFEQWLFDRQWRHLRHHANLRGVRLFGDFPIYPALHSADVWLQPELFLLDEKGHPRFVSGTPPDAFSRTGQSWGTPVYDWDAHVAQRFHWWLERMRARLGRYDLLRIDHFRGLAAAWTIPVDAKSAAEGAWQPVPGHALLQVLADELPELELVVEDLGHITDDVHDLRNAFGLPGMRVLQFAFDENALNPHLPEQVEPWSVYYTGTHDNDTTLGWWQQLTRNERRQVETGRVLDDKEMPWPLMRLVFRSAAGLAMAPMQDFLSLDSRARFNTPGTVNGNWTWQLEEGQLGHALAERIRGLVVEGERCP